MEKNFKQTLSIFAFYFALKNKWLLSAGLAVLACLIHPLMALPVLFVLWVLFTQKYKSGYAFLVFGVIFGLIWGILGIHTFNKLFLTYDSTWWHLVTIHNPFCILSKWRSGKMITQHFLGFFALRGYLVF